MHFTFMVGAKDLMISVSLTFLREDGTGIGITLMAPIPRVCQILYADTVGRLFRDMLRCCLILMSTFMVSPMYVCFEEFEKSR